MKNCDLSLKDLGHSFSPYGPPSQQITYIYLKKDISTAFIFQVRQRNENVARTQMISVVELFFPSLLAVQDDNFPLWNQFSAFLQRGWSCDKKSEGRSF